MSRILCISPVPGTKFIGLEVIQSESETKSDTQSISLGSEKSRKTNTNPKISHSGYASDEDVTGPQNIMAFDSSSEDEEGLGQESFLGGKFAGDGTSPFDVDGRLSPEGSSLGTTGSADGLDSSADENVFDFEENDSSCDEMKGKGSRKHSKRRMGSSRTHSKDSLDLVNFETDETCTVWLGTEDGWYVCIVSFRFRFLFCFLSLWKEPCVLINCKLDKHATHNLSCVTFVRARNFNLLSLNGPFLQHHR